MMQVLFYVALSLGLGLLTFFVLWAMLRGVQLQILELRMRRQLNQKDFEGALVTIGQALRLNPAGGSLYYQRAQLYTQMGDFLSAEADYTHVLRFSQSATAYAGRAAARLKLDMTKEALVDANHAIACSRLWWRGYYERGRVYATLGHYSIALDDFNQALDLNRTPPSELYLARAEAADHLGDSETAGRDRQRATELSRS
ncbi:MAG TPA: tetratricopeptide repeat protein [Chloroflexia bacterium]|nr:tetratricopeptide repeat protein [Chloroflexia bacterium]